MIKFNAALLAKQGWRLTNNDMSLFYRVFKSKYFPDCSWLEENPKQCGSYAWQSIMSSRHVVLKGSRWRMMSLNNKWYLVVRVKGCRSSGSCVFKRQCESIFKKRGKMNLVYGNSITNICNKALGFRDVSLYQYDSLVIPVKNLVLITVYKFIIFLLKSS